MTHDLDRLEWITREVKFWREVNILDADFVDRYIRAFPGVKWEVTMWGANKCPQLGRDLKKLYDRGVLSRYSCGLSTNWQPGFPKWVWSYSMKE